MWCTVIGIKTMSARAYSLRTRFRVSCQRSRHRQSASLSGRAGAPPFVVPTGTRPSPRTDCRRRPGSGAVAMRRRRVGRPRGAAGPRASRRGAVCVYVATENLSALFRVSPRAAAGPVHRRLGPRPRSETGTVASRSKWLGGFRREHPPPTRRTGVMVLFIMKNLRKIRA